MAPPARVSAGCGELGSAKPLGPRMSRQMSTSTCVTAPNSPDVDASQDLLGRAVENIVVVLDEVPAAYPVRAAPVSRAPRRWELPASPR